MWVKKPKQVEADQDGQIETTQEITQLVTQRSGLCPINTLEMLGQHL